MNNQIIQLQEKNNDLLNKINNNEKYIEFLQKNITNEKKSLY